MSHGDTRMHIFLLFVYFLFFVLRTSCFVLQSSNMNSRTKDQRPKTKDWGLRTFHSCLFLYPSFSRSSFFCYFFIFFSFYQLYPFFSFSSTVLPIIWFPQSSVNNVSEQYAWHLIPAHYYFSLPLFNVSGWYQVLKTSITLILFY